MENKNITKTIESKNLSYHWDSFVTQISKVFRLTKEEENNFKNSITAKIIATIPFVAGCKDAERTAIAHLSLYMVEKQGFQDYCCHLPSDDDNLLERLSFISTFEGGNQLVIEHGMYILALIMIEGYKHSAKKDIKYGIYNPIANGKWHYTTKKNEILTVLKKFPCEELDSLLSNALLYPKRMVIHATFAKAFQETA